MPRNPLLPRARLPFAKTMWEDALVQRRIKDMLLQVTLRKSPGRKDLAFRPWGRHQCRYLRPLWMP